jgi:hypothetical protein
MNFPINPLFANDITLCQGAAIGRTTSKMESIFLTNLDKWGLLNDLFKELIKARKVGASSKGQEETPPRAIERVDLTRSKGSRVGYQQWECLPKNIKIVPNIVNKQVTCFLSLLQMVVL